MRWRIRKPKEKSGFLGGTSGEEPTCQCRGEGNGTPLQCSCLENPMDGGAWWATVHGVTRSWTRLSGFTFTFHFHFSLSCIGEGNGNPLQCSCLENPMDRVAWWAAIYGVAQNRTQLKRLSSSSRFYSPGGNCISSLLSVWFLISCIGVQASGSTEWGIGFFFFFFFCLPASQSTESNLI